MSLSDTLYALFFRDVDQYHLKKLEVKRKHLTGRYNTVSDELHGCRPSFATSSMSRPKALDKAECKRLKDELSAISVACEKLDITRKRIQKRLTRHGNTVLSRAIQ